MVLEDKFVNPLTDFGFKKLFGTEPNKELVIDFLNQLLPEKHKIEDLTYSNNEAVGLVLRHLSELQNRPKTLQDKIFKKLFEAAEIANFSLEDRQAYEDSLKYYRDLKNVVDTSREKGIEEGKIEGRKEGKIEGKIEVAIELKKNKVPIEIIIKSTGLTKEEIENL
ncbi:MAG: PD-(D/E)XK nuclease family transposase [Saprospiraceae bacterium]